MKKCAILYIATGPYIKFWSDFFNSFENKFLKNYEKHYYVFTDAETFYNCEQKRVHVLYQSAMPWPLVTLLKFHIYLKVADELCTFDFVYTTNANIICNQEITEQEIIPDQEKGENYIFTMHPGYIYDKQYRHKCYFEYERNPKSLAYVPYNRGKNYVYGNMWGASGESFVQRIRDFDYRINEDLKKRIIAIWHDESFVNHYVASHSDYKILNPGFCYPVGFDLEFEKKIIGVPKETVFDINDFKGYYIKQNNVRLLHKILNRYKNIYKLRILPKVYFFRDSILKKEPAR